MIIIGCSSLVTEQRILLVEGKSKVRKENGVRLSNDECAQWCVLLYILKVTLNAVHKRCEDVSASR